MGLETGVTELEDLVVTNPVFNDARSEGDDHLRLIKVAVKTLLTSIGMKNTPGNKAISSGSITPDYAIHGLTPETGTTDDLTTIVTTNLAIGRILALYAPDAGDTITVKDNASPGAGEIALANGEDCALVANTGDWILLFRLSTYWIEVLRSVDSTASQRGYATAVQITKLDAMDANATDDQTGAEIKTAYEAEANAFTDAQFTKLAAIESGATADQTGAEIKTAYEAEVSAFTDAQFTKLAGIEALAKDDQTAVNIRALGFFDITNDGAGSGLDADKLDGDEGALFAKLASPTFTGTPLAPTAISSDVSTKIATTQHVTDKISSGGGAGSGINADLLDSQQGAFYQNAGNLNAGTIAAGRLVAADILTLMLTVDGVGSGLDADLLDGETGGYYQNASNLNTGTIPSGRLSAADLLTLIKTVDGAGSGLDADLLDAQSQSYYRNASNLNAGTVPAARLSAADLLTLIKTVDGSGSGLDADLLDGQSFDTPGAIGGTTPGSGVFTTLQANDEVTITDATLAVLNLRATGGAADEERWRLLASTTRLVLQANSDDGLSQANILLVDRTGISIDQVLFPQHLTVAGPDGFNSAGETAALVLGATINDGTGIVDKHSTGLILGVFKGGSSGSLPGSSSFDALQIAITSGDISIFSTTESSGVLTGSFQTLGGMGVVKKLYVGGDVSIGGAMVGANWPSFFVHRNGVQQDNITSIDQVEYTDDSAGEGFDTGGDYNTSTFRFTPTQAGKYLLTASIHWTAISTGDRLGLYLRKNGANVAINNHTVNSASEYCSLVTVILDANGSGDYFEVFADNLGRNTSNILGVTTDTYFCGSRIA